MCRIFHSRGPFFDECLLLIFALQVMSRLGVWGLDVFLVSDLSDERPLTVTTYTIFQVIKVYQLSSVKQMFWKGETRNTTFTLRRRVGGSFFICAKDMLASPLPLFSQLFYTSPYANTSKKICKILLLPFHYYHYS